MSSKRRLRRRGCENKIPYPTKDEARAAASRINRSGKGSGQSAYRCDFGDHFHIGRANKERKAARTVSRQLRRGRA